MPEEFILEVAAGDGLVKHARMMEIKSNELQVRRSACADAALRAGMKRVEKMTVEERIKAALSLGRRFSGIQKTTKGK